MLVTGKLCHLRCERSERIKNRAVITFVGCAMALCASCSLLAAELVEQNQLAEKIVEKVYADGSREIVANGTVLRDTTPPPEPPPERVSEQERKQGYVLYRRELSDGVFRYSSPKPEERISNLATSISLGEKRHVQFAVYALQDLGQVQVSAESLAQPGSITVPDEAVTIRPVRVGLWRNYWNPTFREAPKLIELEPNIPRSSEANRCTRQSYQDSQRRKPAILDHRARADYGCSWRIHYQATHSTRGGPARRTDTASKSSALSTCCGTVVGYLLLPSI